MADIQLINEIKFWATKYLVLSYIGGINIAYFAYHLAFKKLRRYVGLPLTFITFFECRNLIMKNCMDKIYFPIEPLYKELRGEEKQSETDTANGDGATDGKKKPLHVFDELKSEVMQQDRKLQAIEAEIYKEQEQDRKDFDELIEKIHGRYINEDDFETGVDGYRKFIDLYIRLYYEPLVERYDEARYYTEDYDRALLKKIKYHRLQKIVKIEMLGDK